MEVEGGTMKNELLLLMLIVFVFFLDTEKAMGEGNATYKVRDGDCMSVIGKNLGLDWEDLAKKNNIKPPRYLVIMGATLKIEGVKKRETKVQKPVVAKNRTSRVQKRSRGVVDGRLLLSEFEEYAKEDKALQRALDKFTDDEEEKSLFEKEIADGNREWGFFEDGDKCYLFVDSQGSIHEKRRLSWKQGREKGSLEAAGVYRSPSGKEIWFLLNGRTICFKDEDAVSASKASKKGKLKRLASYPDPAQKRSLSDAGFSDRKKQKSDRAPRSISSGEESNFFGDVNLRKESSGFGVPPKQKEEILGFALPPLDVSLSPGKGEEIRLGQQLDPLKGFAKEGDNILSMETIAKREREKISPGDPLKGFAKEGDSVSSMETIARREIEKIFPKDVLKVPANEGKVSDLPGKVRNFRRQKRDKETSI
ncbi:MAG: hypothetical protein ACD_15C00193G0013 [uncultured bacterium]|nr:MAG: hypothetical protein ACD_15C00193G0013 [uncultured bacterium]